MKRIVIFGGTGFIGTHTALRLLRSSTAEQILLVDVAPPRVASYTTELQQGLANNRVRFLQHDIRQPFSLPDFSPDVIFNFAAVHREPGHQPHEYYETNLKGAAHVCAYAEATGCQRLVFTSSISPYGPTEESRDEDSLPVPETPYGGSKLVAEKIHIAWQVAAPGRKLLIVRPGVVFGPGEGGNVTRLVRSLVKGYFVYMGNRETRKAGGYVKELVNVFLFGLDALEQHHTGQLLLNFSMFPTPALQEYVSAICKSAGIRRRPFSVPRKLLLGISYPIEGVASIFGIKQPISPTRVRKLYRSTNIEARRLQEMGYRYQYTIEEAFADWRKDKPEDFLR
ncbi:MAG: NAD(P)-dependent oxidoreductase [Acidobacterium ailaaui]|nr:NAD(P)-dependent oxidoreductase [Pseudacidobacterium ailaaui]MDI3254197.1 NAD(P)-dependent oxidoreductase [Bacillota bacterium]